MADTSRIHSLVARGRRRLKQQSALDAGVLAVVPAAAAVAVAIFLVRLEVLSETAGLALIALSAGAVLGAAVLGWMRRFPTEVVATRIDRASGLSDRLATACAFEELLRRAPEGGDGDGPVDQETRDLMLAAIEDAVRAAPRADVVAATPLRWPRDTRAALAFSAVAALVSLLDVRLPPTAPVISRCYPVAAARNTEIEIFGSRFGEAGALYVGAGEKAVEAPIVDWQPGRIRARVPADVAVGKTVLVVTTDGGRSNQHPFEVLPDGMRLRDPNEPLALAEDDLEYTRDLLEELRRTAEQNGDPELRALTDEIEKLLEKAEKGELSREELLAAINKAHDEYMQGGDEELMAEALKDLEKTGAELQKSQLTREIGKALAKGDLGKAQKEMEKLAEKLAKGELSEKQAAEAARALEKAAEKFEKRQAEREKAADKQVEKAQKEVEKAKKQLAEAATKEQREQAERRLRQKMQELEQAQKQREKQQAAIEKRTLKRLHRNMKKAAEQMREPSDQERRMASRTMEDMARDTGKVDADRRKITNKKKVASQLSDLKEAMRRAKRGGSRGPQDRFGRNKRNADFQKRARGGRGSRQAWRPQGGQGKGNQGKGGQGNQPGGSSWGTGHDPDLLGDPTPRQGNTKDESVSGIHGKGPSVRETILSSAQKGFASQSYKQVYARYKAIVEEVINAEKVPSGYKYYVKKYFQKIKPHEM